MKSQNAVVTQQVDIDALKAKHKATWEDGNYADFATYMHDGALEILQGWDFSEAKTLLDVGCGSGQTAIPAAKMGLKVTGIDIAENLIDHARKSAKKAKLDAQFDVGDAENLPYENNSFDTAITMIGAMFAPQPDQVTSEFARVLKQGGSLHMANWTPESMPAQMFKCVAEILPPPAGFIPPVLWGKEETVNQRLGGEFKDIRLSRKNYPQWHYPFDEHELINLFREQFGPVKRAFEMATEVQEKQLYDELFHIYRNNSETRNGVLTITGGEYLDVIATRR
jgi:SAM-dependent methyltransferase